MKWFPMTFISPESEPKILQMLLKRMKPVFVPPLPLILFFVLSRPDVTHVVDWVLQTDELIKGSNPDLN